MTASNPEPATGTREYIDVDESVADECYGRQLVNDLEAALADLVAEMERKKEAA